MHKNVQKWPAAGVSGVLGDNDIDLEANEPAANLGDALVVPVCPSKLNRNGLALDPAEFAKPLHKGGGPLASGRGSTRA